MTKPSSPRPLRLKILTGWFTLTALAVVSNLLLLPSLYPGTTWYEASRYGHALYDVNGFLRLAADWAGGLCGVTIHSYSYGLNHTVLFGFSFPSSAETFFYVISAFVNTFLAIGVWRMWRSAYLVGIAVLGIDIVNHTTSFFFGTLDTNEVAFFVVFMGVGVASLKLFLLFFSRKSAFIKPKIAPPI